jgi:hypothetical protein
MWHHPWHGNNGWPVVIVARPGNNNASAHRAIAGEQYTIVSDITSMSLSGYGVLQCDKINCLLPNTQSIHAVLACLTSQPFQQIRHALNTRAMQNCSLMDHFNHIDSLGLCQSLAVDAYWSRIRMWHHPWHGNNRWPFIIVLPGNNDA